MAHNMKKIRTVVSGIVLSAFLFAPLAGFAAEKKDKPKPYRLKTCVVSGDKLGEMGDPVVYVHGDQEIKFCCKNCIKDFKKDPAKYLKKIHEAEAKANANAKK
jgi:hypothetical protein